MKRILVVLCLLLTFISSAQEIKRLYYKDSVIAREKWYGADGKIDSLKTYFKNGNLDEVFYYDTKGKFHGLCYQLNPKGQTKTSWKFEHGKLIERSDPIKVYSIKNKETMLKRYEKIALVNKRIEEKNTLGRQFARAHYRNSLGNKTLALIDLLRLEKITLTSKKRVTDPKKIKNLNSRLASIYDKLGGIYGTYEQENKAIHYRYLAVKTKPKNAVYDYNLGGYLIYIKQYELGMHYLEELLKRGYKHSFANWAMCMAHTDLGNYEIAQKYLAVARAHEKSLYTNGFSAADRELNTLEGYLSHKQGNTEKGVEFLNEALTIKSNNSFAMRYLGEIYVDLGNYDVACDFLQEAKTLGYEKIHDRDDLTALIDIACNRRIEKTETVSKPTAIPNPVITTTEIHNVPKNFNYTLFNFEQQIVQQGRANGTTINLSLLPSGLYVLQILNKDQISTLKIIKQ